MSAPTYTFRCPDSREEPHGCGNIFEGRKPDEAECPLCGMSFEPFEVFICGDMTDADIAWYAANRPDLGIK
jgi:hypothetical protein